MTLPRFVFTYYIILFVFLWNWKIKRSDMEIKVLGVGCPRCQALERAVINSLAELDIVADVSKVTDINEIISYGILHTPGLVINNKVVLSGRVPSTNEVKELIISNRSV
jgi:small redox-active disulfide protein 2